MVMECGGGDALYLGSLVRARERASTFEDGPMDISQIETQKEKRTKNSRTFKSEKSIKMDHTYITGTLGGGWGARQKIMITCLELLFSW